MERILSSEWLSVRIDNAGLDGPMGGLNKASYVLLFELFLNVSPIVCMMVGIRHLRW